MFVPVSFHSPLLLSLKHTPSLSLSYHMYTHTPLSLSLSLSLSCQLKNEDYFSQFVTEDFQHYINRKRSDRCCGNNLEIQALAEMYNRTVEIFQYSIGKAYPFLSALLPPSPFVDCTVIFFLFHLCSFMDGCTSVLQSQSTSSLASTRPTILQSDLAITAEFTTTQWWTPTRPPLVWDSGWQAINPG